MVYSESRNQKKVESDECYLTHLIDGDGTLNATGLEKFIEKVELAKHGLSYVVVSIIGPQSSGKSTLLNHLFGTNFQEMDAYKGRYQTTKGIWIAHCPKIEPCTIVMDLEGTDGRERGEDDTAFEKQSALFAVAVSDVVLINMWCHDIGRVQAANEPLLRTIFQVLKRLFSPRKTTLMFVIRDKTKTPLEYLECDLKESIQKIWNNIPKPEAHKETALSEFFNVEVVALPDCVEKEKEFKEEVDKLRERFFYSIAPGGLAGDRREVVPASSFVFSVQQFWKTIKENKDLNLPAHNVMLATVRCEEILNKKFSSFLMDKEWNQLQEAVQSHLVDGFGQKFLSLLESTLSGYDAEAVDFDEGVRSAKRKQLEEKLLELVQPAWQSVMHHLQFGIIERFKKAFDEALNKGEGFALAARECSKSVLLQLDEGFADATIEQVHRDSSKVRNKVHCEIDAYMSKVRNNVYRDIDAYIDASCSAKLLELTRDRERKLNEVLSRSIEDMLGEAGDGTWLAIRNLLRHETGIAMSEFSATLSGYQMDEKIKHEMLSRLKDHGRAVVEAKAQEGARMVLVLIRMKDRFKVSLQRGSDSSMGNRDIRAIIKNARLASLKVLSVMAAIRLDIDADNIEETLYALANEDATSSYIFTTNVWEEVPESKTLITPRECKDLWYRFRAESRNDEALFIAAQGHQKRNRRNWMLPTCICFVLVVVGFLFGFFVFFFLRRSHNRRPPWNSYVPFGNTA